MYHLTQRKSRIKGREWNAMSKEGLDIHSSWSLFRSAGFPLTAYVFGTVFQNLANGEGLDQRGETQVEKLVAVIL